MLPTFVLIGARKAGTVALHVYLRDHPQIFMSIPKEPIFFMAEGNWGLGLRWYEELFDGADGALAVGEASVGYSDYPKRAGVAQRMASVIPDARLVYLVRHPIDRIRSDYQDQVLRGTERRPITEALVADRSYLDRSRYAFQIDQYLEHFDRDRLLVVTSEDLRHARLATLSRIYRFLGVDDGWESSSPTLTREYHRTAEWRVGRPALDPIRRTRPYRALSSFAPGILKRAVRPLTTRKARNRHRPELPPALRKHLEDGLRDDIRRLPDFLGRDFDGWGIG
jgi:hypothetical protein